MKQPNIHKMLIQLQHLIHNAKIHSGWLSQLYFDWNVEKIFCTDLMGFWRVSTKNLWKFFECCTYYISEFVRFGTILIFNILGIVLSKFVLSGDPLYLQISISWIRYIFDLSDFLRRTQNLKKKKSSSWFGRLLSKSTKHLCASQNVRTLPVDLWHWHKYSILGARRCNSRSSDKDQWSS